MDVPRHTTPQSQTHPELVRDGGDAALFSASPNMTGPGEHGWVSWNAQGTVTGEETFDSFVRRAAGYPPYPYQSRLAEAGLPDLLRVPTGAGKTLAAVLPWLYRRRFHPDRSVRRSTPRRLVVVLPQRSLVEQTAEAVRGWLGRLALTTDVNLHVLMGGMSGQDQDWQRHPERDAVLVGTQDMVLSRLLMRGYAETRASWPISFGVLHTDTQFVFDEIQLMGPALPTSLQLEGLRGLLGAAAPCRSMWMSATVDPKRFDTADFPGLRTVVELDVTDRSGVLLGRLTATRTVQAGSVEGGDAKTYSRAVARLLLDHHVPATRSIAVVNTVDRAAQVYDALISQRPKAEIVLLHSRFRPGERAAQMARALGEPGPDGTIVVSTQVLEAGVDTDSRVLLTELAPWSSIVQRAGRCNRAGRYDDATLLWVTPPGTNPKTSAAPYAENDLACAAEALRALEGVAVTSTALQERDVAEDRPLYPVLRRRDLLDLFDTSTDLSGNDVDVTRWIRDADTAAVSVGWRDYGSGGPPGDAPALGREEICPAPVKAVRDHISGKHGRRAWVFDQTQTEWRAATDEDVRPGSVILLDAEQGGYHQTRGWAPGSTGRVLPVPPARPSPAEGLDSDPLSTTATWVTLADHLDDVRRETAALLDRLGDLPGLTALQRAAAVRAGALHDLGKAHEVFADSLAQVGEPPGPGPWAKSGGRGRLYHARKGFRHELVSALMVLDPASGLLDGEAEPDLVCYLVAAHHGKVRMAARSVPGEQNGWLLGVAHGDRVGPITLGDGHRVPVLDLHPDVFELGSGRLGESWVTRTCRLRDRADLGPFRLGFLEAVVRLADWTASASYEEPT